MKSHGKSKAVLTAVIFEVNLLQSSRFGDLIYKEIRDNRTKNGNENHYCCKQSIPLIAICIFHDLPDHSGLLNPSILCQLKRLHI